MTNRISIARALEICRSIKFLSVEPPPEIRTAMGNDLLNTTFSYFSNNYKSSISTAMADYKLRFGLPVAKVMGRFATIVEDLAFEATQ